MFTLISGISSPALSPKLPHFASVRFPNEEIPTVEMAQRGKCLLGKHGDSDFPHVCKKPGTLVRTCDSNPEETDRQIGSP